MNLTGARKTTEEKKSIEGTDAHGYPPTGMYACTYMHTTKINL